MPAIAERVSTTPEIDNIQTALRASAYSNHARDVDLTRLHRHFVPSGSSLIDYLQTFALTRRFAFLESKIAKMDELLPNWDTYGAEPPNNRSKKHARQILLALQQRELPPTDIVASSEGGVALSFAHGQRYADIECLNSGEVLAVTVLGQEEPNVWEVETENIAGTIERIRVHITA